MWKKKAESSSSSSTSYMDPKTQRMEIQSIMKDIESLGSKHMTWKQRKELENKKVVALGGKPVKKQRLPLSVARVVMKKQKEREQKMLQESSILGRVGWKSTGGSKRFADKRNPEDRVLKSTVGTFRNGVLDVKNLLHTPVSSRDADVGSSHGGGNWKKKKGGKKNQGKKKGGGGGGARKRH